MLTEFKFIDLFCGIGGFHQALESLGGKCVFASDIDKYCQRTYYKNYGMMPVGDITQVDASDIPAHDVLCAGFPCQSFSIAGKRLGFADPTKGTLFFDIMRIVHHHHPKYLLLENVRNLASHDNGNTWAVIHQSLCDAGYNVSPIPVIFSPHYIGIPQHRERVFIMGIRKDVGELPRFYFNRKKAPVCTIDTILQEEHEIANVHKYRMKKRDIEVVDLWNEFLAGLVELGIKLPLFPVTDMFLHPSLAYIDYDSLHEEKATFARRNVQLFNQCPDFIRQWLRKAYKNPGFRGSRRMLEWHAGKKTTTPDLWDTVLQFRQSGVRARPANHFPTLTAVMQIPVIGKRKRKLTPRECARLQSFPDTFIPDERDAQAYKQFGNSVNVEVVRLFARFLLGDLEVQERFAYNGEDEKPPSTGKRRGRPRKIRPEIDAQLFVRRRGRPRKIKIAPAAKEGPGRPRKESIEDLLPQEFHQKRGRGRPRKEDVDARIAKLRELAKPHRGRPRREEAAARQVLNQMLEKQRKKGQPEADAPVKRGRGRPRKNPTV